ncbi:hypothetical protein SODALDRAFT_317507 [Sodiomyces alkalinus F11]|uniref:Cep57 centrosome microtubule-binding domain-containing protein n=1 Tax=Sodiomyces alkalinus (strain CBS 110278 / VKM F-3762 / F11) TaxID=1314773 RepID=A0A3N2PKA2_SODAK|nr:hypothetical protein SODALDRAFT_317507 [Sodiomyces alkalinus F11]ROT34972.1 hypothetical protein SODALDRAFT_317507 [Sodiomyces alkalinus F11]
MGLDTTTSRYRSRILREMNANRENPFNSPPSSTGSHGTVSPTMSSVISDPDGESTRRLNEDIARLTGSRNGKPQVNWEAAHIKWPEQTKHSEDPWQDSKRTRAEMQPRVDNDSDNSSTFSKSPIRFDMRRPDMARLTHQPRTRSPLSRAHKRVASGADHQQQQQPLPPQSPSNGKGPLSRSQTSPSLAAHAAETGTSNQAGGNNNVPFKHSPANLNTIRKSFPSPVATDSPLHNGATVQSFFMPDISHLNDLVSGTLRVGGLKDGVPVFVKNGRVRDRADIRAPNDHAEVEGLAIPEDEENIFISMDKIREEIENLQQHDDIMQRHAESLQGEVDRLQNELSRFKSRKSIDSALGSRTGSEPETAAYEQLVTEKLVLESQVASLQARLDQASRRIGVDEVENNTLSLERDRALKKLQDACENIGDLMDKLDLREKELNDTQKKLDATLQMQGNNNTQTASRSDAGTSRREHNAQDGHDGQDGHEGLESENKSLQVESLREDNNSLRREHESLLSENRSLRSSVRALMTETEELRRTVDDGQREVASAREESDALHQELEAMEQERDSLKEDNDSLVRHNEKYFGENKLLRRENGGFERSIHDLHDENERLKEEVEFLKEQLDHCRPIGKDHDFSARLGQDNDYDNDNDYDEENMTSAFFVPDITIDENSAVVDPTLDSVKGPPDMPTRSQRPTEIADTTALTEGSVAGPDDTADLHKRPSAGREKALVEGRDDTGHVQQKVAFSLPDVTQDTTRGTTTTNNNMANKGSKRRSASRAGHRSNTTGTSIPELEAFHLLDQDNSMVFSPDITQNLSVALDTQARGGQTAAAAPSHSQSQGQGQGQSQSQSQKTAGIKSSMKSKHHRSATVDVTTTRRRQDANTTATSVRSECPALSPDARRVLDGLCEHNCNNCVVCSRISSHRGTVTLKEAAEGKKRVKVPKPVPASEQQQQQQQKALQHQQQKGHQRYTDEPTMRPWQAPGTALAMVIKGLEDEAAHMKMELARLQARYGELDASVGRRERKEVASRVKEALRRLEVKNDQIYALYDVLEGQKQAGQAMTEEELEVTIFSITGLTVRDISLNLAREGVAV